MVLASQSPRLSPRGRFNTNVGGRRLSPQRLVLALAVLAVLAGGWWIVRTWLWKSDSVPSNEVRTGPVGVKEPQAPTPPTDLVIANPPTSETAAPSTTTPNPPPIASKPATVVVTTASDDGKGDDVATPSSGIIGSPEGGSATQSGTAATIPDAGSSRASLDAAMAVCDSDPVRARMLLTRLLEGSALPTVDRLRGYDAINKINGVLVFSNRTLGNDPYSASYKVQPGDSLARIAKAEKLDCDWRFLQRVNGVSNPNGLRVGQTLKLPKGAFHGEVRKGEYRLNIFMGEGQDRVMVASYPIGLGELNSTPTGAFVVRPKSKLINPEWRNPRTGEYFGSDDPKNPIGERWIGLKGIEPHNKGFEGYGIHGTVDLDSIGQQRSMGCVRMRPGDVEVVYELITEPNSTVTIAP